MERFEPYIAGMEVGNAYTELNDPMEQEKTASRTAKTGKSSSWMRTLFMPWMWGCLLQEVWGLVLSGW